MLRTLLVIFVALLTLAGRADTALLGLFTDANRQVFAQGEEIEVSAVLVAPKPTTGELALTLTGLNLALPLYTTPMSADGRATVTVRLRPELTARLRPGAYALHAKLGALESLPLPLHLVETLRPTHFVIYNDPHVGGSESNLTLTTGAGVDDPNAWTDNPYHLSAVERARAPEEWALPRFAADLAAETALADQQAEIVRLHWGWAHTLRLGLERNLRDYQHSYAVAAERLKRFPSFAGFSYGEDIHTLGDWTGGSADAPFADPDFAARMTQYIGDVAAQRPELKITRDNLLPEKSQLWRGWTGYVTGLFPDAATRWHAALSAQLTNFVTTHGGSLPTLCNMGAGNYPPALYRAMTAVQGHADTGPFAEELGAEMLLLARQTQPVWVGSHTRLDRVRTLRLLSRGVDGVSAARDDLPLRLGDLCLGLQPEREVALLYSYTQAMFDVDTPAWRASFRTPDDHANPNLADLTQRDAVTEAYADLRRCGYQVHLVSEDGIRDGALTGYAALFVVGMTHTLPGAVLDRLGEFQASGGTVFQDDDTTVPVPDAVTMKVSFADAGYAAWVQAMKAQRAPLPDAPTLDTLYYTTGQNVRRALRKALADVLTPVAVSSDPRALCATARWGQARYFFLTADAPPGLTFHEAPTVTLPDDGVLYDLLAQKPVYERTFTVAEGRLLAQFPTRIAAVELRAPDAVSPGARLPLAVRVLGPHAPLDGLVPVEIEVVDPQGQVRWHLYRAAGGVDGLREELPLAANDPPGAWTVRVTERASGLWAQKSVLVRTETYPLAPRAVFRVPDVAVSGLDALRALLHPDTEVLVVLDAGQEEYRLAAGQLADRLTAAGLQSRVVTPTEVALLAAGFPLRPERAFTDDLPDLPHHVVLLSGAHVGTLYARLAHHGAAARTLTRNFPGTGNGLIDYHWSPFTGGYDAISLAANDDVGLRKALDVFLTLVGGTVPPEIAACATQAQNLEHVRTALLPPRIAWRPAPATWEPPLDADPLTTTGVTYGQEGRAR